MNTVDIRQELWDRLLIEGWLDESYMWIVFWQYAYGRGDYSQVNNPEKNDIEYMANVRRGIRNAFEKNLPVRAFFDLALPTTNKWLWAGARGERVMKILAQESRVQGCVANARRQKNRSRLSPNKHSVKLHEQQNNMRVDPHAGHRRSDWGKVKSTNN